MKDKIKELLIKNKNQKLSQVGYRAVLTQDLLDLFTQEILQIKNPYEKYILLPFESSDNPKFILSPYIAFERFRTDILNGLTK